MRCNPPPGQITYNQRRCEITFSTKRTKTTLEGVKIVGIDFSHDRGGRVQGELKFEAERSTMEEMPTLSHDALYDTVTPTPDTQPVDPPPMHGNTADLSPVPTPDDEPEEQTDESPAFQIHGLE